MSYYISTEKLNTQMKINGEFEKKVIITRNRCDCGESWGFIIENENEQVIVCDACYENAPNKEKYC